MNNEETHSSDGSSVVAAKLETEGQAPKVISPLSAKEASNARHVDALDWLFRCTGPRVCRWIVYSNFRPTKHRKVRKFIPRIAHHT
jgi:hypothetical protein